jgi:hypothetical protein
MVELEHLYASKPFTYKRILIRCNAQIWLRKFHPNIDTDYKCWRLTFLRALPVVRVPDQGKKHRQLKSYTDQHGYTTVTTITIEKTAS